MADAIKAENGVKAKLIAGGGGIFDVKVDGKLIFSKHETGRFPEDNEIIRQLSPVS